MSNKTDALHEGLKKMLNYLPMIYNQQQLNTVNDGKITIKYPYDKIPENAILFVLPLYSSLEYNNKLAIKFAQVSQNGTVVSYDVVKEYNIMVEDINGTKRAAGLGDIVANRLCMFRFMTNNSSEIILINNPIYNNLNCSTLCITNSAKFHEIPKYVKEINGIEREFEVALNQDLQTLEARVTALENKFKVGTESAEEYFANNPTAEKGTIYLQVEE
jgi:hypothetical protein